MQKPLINASPQCDGPVVSLRQEDRLSKEICAVRCADLRGPLRGSRNYVTAGNRESVPLRRTDIFAGVRSMR